MKRYTQAERTMLLLYALPGEEILKESTYRRLYRALEAMGAGVGSADRKLQIEDLQRLDCTHQEAETILRRLDQDELLRQYLSNLSAQGVQVICRVSPEYPQRLRDILGDRAPLVLYCAGALELLSARCISLVGSRQLRPLGRSFAIGAGRAMVRQGFVCCSGGAAGADTAAFQGAMEQGGRAVIFLADSLLDRMKEQRYQRPLTDGRVLLISEHGPDVPFSTPRAMRRNRLIHAMGEKVLVAQSDYGKGGTWNGTVENLKAGWSPVFVFSGDAQVQGSMALLERGAESIAMEQLSRLSQLEPCQISF